MTSSEILCSFEIASNDLMPLLVSWRPLIFSKIFELVCKLSSDVNSSCSDILLPKLTEICSNSGSCEKRSRLSTLATPSHVVGWLERSVSAFMYFLDG